MARARVLTVTVASEGPAELPAEVLDTDLDTGLARMRARAEEKLGKEFVDRRVQEMLGETR
jgi:hypothetical protein